MPRGRKPRHGHSIGGRFTRSYSIWLSMTKRCRDPKANSYQRYGGRGIKVCQRWLTFENFLSDMGEAPADREIDRINNDGDYEPGNCRWATRREQVRNSVITRYLTQGDETLCITEWEKKLGLSRGAVSHRLMNGWPLDKALTLRRTRR